MARRETYERQVALLVRILPILAEERDFALKGGTAINLFVRDFPRLSVDIDLTYLPVQTWIEAIQGIDAGLDRITSSIMKGVRGAQVAAQRSPEGPIERLHVQAGAAVKIEVTPMMRGVVYEPVLMRVTDAVEEKYGFAETWVVSQPDLYAGKIVAALDRQHPRDLYDVKLLLENEGVSDDLRHAFIAYLLSSTKGLNAILNPPRRDLARKYEQEFVGMTAEDTSLQALLDVRETLIEVMVGGMSEEHRQFLVSFKRGEPDWSLLGQTHMADLPAVQYRVQKLAELSPVRRQAEFQKLTSALYPGHPSLADSKPSEAGSRTE